MKRSREEEQLRMLIRETIIQEGIWDSIKSGVGKAYDYIADIADFDEPSSGFMKTLDDLSPDDSTSSGSTPLALAAGGSIASMPVPEGPTRVTDLISQRSRISLSSKQLEMMRLIERVLRDQGFTDAGIAAAFANAWQESKFDPDASGDNGHAIGLFQLHDSGVGEGMSVAARKDPVINTLKIADSALSSKFGQLMRTQQEENNHDPQVLASAFSAFVERPADRDGNIIDRAETVRKFLGIDTVSPGIQSILNP